MSIPQSKLMVQLGREQPAAARSNFSEQIMDDIYNTICKQEPKNLMLSQYMALIIEKQFLRNSHLMKYFVDLYDSIRNSCPNRIPEEGKSSQEAEDARFSRKKFSQLMKKTAQKIFPGHCNPYQSVFFERLMRTEGDEHRLRVDESIRKLLNHEVITAISQYDAEFKGIFEAYMPENYNLALCFSWDQIKILQKKLPIICFLRFLNEAEIVPHFVQPAQFLQLVTKLKPPTLPSSGSTKEAMFYTTEALSAYIRDHCSQPHIRLLDGDLGLTFLEVQILFIRVACDFAKDSKQCTASIHRLAEYGRLKQAFQSGTTRKSRFMETISNNSKLQTGKGEKIVVKKRESNKQIEDLYDCKDSKMKDQNLQNLYRSMAIDSRQIELIKKDLDTQLAELPQRRKIQKQNNGFFDVQKKHIVIGEQLPKIQQKNKPVAKVDPKKKPEDKLMGYKPEITKDIEESNIRRLIQKPRKLRTNTEFPIILNQVFYPSSLKAQLFIGPKAELYLQTSYIHLGERLYEEAFLNYNKAKLCTESKSSITEFYYNIHCAQIFQSAGRDDVALSFYHHAKELIGVLSSVENNVRSEPYMGMGVCLYHMQEYEYALRCFQKAKSIQGIVLQPQSLDNAILQNNCGCCLMMLNRNQEAARCFELAHCILDLKVGCFDERTLLSQQNLNKNRKAYLEMIPEFKTMWKTYQEKASSKLPVVKSTNKLKK